MPFAPELLETPPSAGYLSSSALAAGLGEEMRAKVAEYEAFVDQRLQPDLVESQRLLDGVHTHLENLKDLRTRIQGMVKAPSPSLETTTDLGQGYLSHVYIPDTQWIYINVGFGFHVQMTLDEALDFTAKQEVLLQKKEKNWALVAEGIRENIQMVYNALAEILQLATMARDE